MSAALAEALASARKLIAADDARLARIRAAGLAEAGPLFAPRHRDLRALVEALSTPPAEDVRDSAAVANVAAESDDVDEALWGVVMNAISGTHSAHSIASAVRACFDVRLHGTVTDADVEAASEQYATSILLPERETRIAQSSFVAGVEWRERAEREARS